MTRTGRGTQAILPRVTEQRLPGHRWFEPYGCVIEYPDRCEVTVGGLLVGQYAPKDRAARNAILVGLAANPRVHLGQLAKAFRLSYEGLRGIRRLYEREGLSAVLRRRPGGKASKVTPALRRQLEELFARGVSVRAAQAKVARRARLSLGVVGRVRREWALARARATAAHPVEESDAAPQASLWPRDATTTPTPPAPTTVVSTPPAQAALPPTGEAGRVHGGALVQHVGAWMLLGQLGRYGLPGLVADLAQEAGLATGPLRVAVDAVAIALALGEDCVEGVRRVATPSAGVLLRTEQAPCADSVRTVLHAFADARAGEFHFGMAGRYLAAAAAATRVAGPTVFYVDNHLRPYTGKHVVRRGWRMQDKRVRPGVTDYYVHDEDGRPVLRYAVPSHDSLVEELWPIAHVLRIGLGRDRRLLLAFDRAGAFPASLCELRNQGVEFVTYERRPYPLLTAAAFDREVVIDGEQLCFCDTRTNVGQGRGRLRRVALRYPDGQQVNLLAYADVPAERLIEVMYGRWRQENGFRHAVQRWGANQLDARRVEAYAPDTIIPNPARRRLDDALRLTRIREGLGRNDLVHEELDAEGRLAVEADIAEAVELQLELLAARPHVPKRARLCDTELAGKLVYHAGEYKAVLDTIRIACVNVEADLAALLGPHLPREQEAKKTLGNLLRAPGQVHIGKSAVQVTLAPAGTSAEYDAFKAFLVQVNALGLRLPGDPQQLPLRFGLQVS